MAKKRIAAVAVLVALGIAAPYVVPPELNHDFKVQWLFYAAAALVGLLKDFGRAAQVASAVALPPDAVVLREGPANFKNGWLMIGGILKLTPDQLVFSAHGFAQKARVFSWPLRDFTGVSAARTLGLVPNAIQVRFGAAEVKLVVTDRKGWMSQIAAAAAPLGTS